MDNEYDRKFEEMKKYIPFLESMIKRLENTSSSMSKNPRQAQLDKIRSLRDLLLNKNKRMKMENLLKCEQVLVNLYAKVERDPFTDNPAVKNPPTSSKDQKAELETVRNKLKTVAKIQEEVETLPEIARANDVEFNYTGSKEPALFQRRPNKSSKSPARSIQRTPTKSKSPQHKRNYSRVLISPDQSPRRWSASEQSSSDKPLFSRRSPTRQISPPPVGRKEKKKSKSSKTRKTKGLNFTLNVPQESLNSLSTKDILGRIINCKDGDVDIDTLRHIRTKILGELKQTGKNDDISDLILDSYNMKVKPRNKISGKNSKNDVEEGELSDSESEAIESIYGSLPAIDKDKKTSTKIKTIDKKDQGKIQICLVISDKIESITANKSREQPQVIDLVSELEMVSENESDISKEVISIDSSNSSPRKNFNPKVGEISNSKNNDSTPQVKIKTAKITECITLEDDNEELQDEAIEISIDESDDQSVDHHNESSVKSKEFPDSRIIEDATVLPSKTNSQNVDKLDLLHSQNTDRTSESEDQQPKFVANFYKPIDENNMSTKCVQPVCTSSDVIAHNPEKQNNDGSNRDSVISVVENNKDSVTNSDDTTKDNEVSFSHNESSNKETGINQEKVADSQNIPLLNEPTVPPQAKSNVLSEIDILQALKNEILSGLPVSGTEVTTPALHQPKLIKVANAQEVMPRKKISIEKYKEQVSTSTSNQPPLFLKNRRRVKQSNEDVNRKQSLKLTEKECERFNFPKRLSLDDDDDDDSADLSDDDFLAEEKDDSFGLDDIYGDLAPKSPDNELLSKSSTPPIIIPTDPKQSPVGLVTNRGDVDMRALLANPGQSQPIVPLPAPPSFQSMRCGPVSSSPAYGIDKNLSEVLLNSCKSVTDINRISDLDPRKRRELSLSAMNSPNPYPTTNLERTPRSFASTAVCAPNVTPSRAPSMTPSYIPQLMTPSHQTFEFEEPSTRKHVYAPSFPMCDNRERESSAPRDIPYWDMKKSDPRSRRCQWEENNKGPIWEDREVRNDGSNTPRYEDSYKPAYDNYSHHVSRDKYNTNERQNSFSKADCPRTPVPSFGWSECPSTPSSGFGRQEAPMTPIHPFGRSECPTTPVHAFGRVDCPSNPSGGFGRNVDMASNHSYSRLECPPTPTHSFGRSECPPTPSNSFGRAQCPSTPIHPFGRSECPPTPSHTFGRSDCPRTPSHQFGRSESIPYNKPDITNYSNQKYSKDPRLNRRPVDNELNSYNERDYDYKSERNRTSSSYRPQNTREYSRDQNHRKRRDSSLGPSTSNDVEISRLYSRNRESRSDGRYSKDYDFDTKCNQRERSIGRASDIKHNVDRSRSTARALSVSRGSGKEWNKDNISFQSDTGRNFTINTSVKSTFQDFLPSGKPIQVFEYSFDARRQRASSVGRSLLRESSAGRSPSKENFSTYAQDRNNKFKRASSVGREILKTNRTLQEVKADFEAFKSKCSVKKRDSIKESKHKDTERPLQASKNEEPHKSQLAAHKKETCKESKIYDTKQHSRTTYDQVQKSDRGYSPRKNNRDPRMRNDHSFEVKSRYKIDRRNKSPDRRKSGIIYSNDNIAKGTTMGSGFGVKNYKIPKIKRVEVEVPEVKKNIKVATEPVENTENLNNAKGSDKKSTQKSTEEPSKQDNNNGSNSNFKNQNESKHSVTENEGNSEVRSTRSKKKTSPNKTTDEIDEDLVVKTRKNKKTIIYDSDSDSTPKQEVPKIIKQGQGLAPNSPSCKSNEDKKESISEKEKKMQKGTFEDSDFGIDDMEIFAENLESNSAIDNINDLIADLDNDLKTSKNSIDSISTDGQIDAVNRSEGDSLGDISEVIEKDPNKFGQNLLSDNLLEKEQDTNQQSVNPVLFTGTLCNISQNDSELTDVNIPMDPKETSALPETHINDQNLAKEFLDRTVSSKENDSIVSTTDNRELNEDKDEMGMKTVANIADQGNVNNSNVLSKTNDGLPDSTNEIQCELSSEVTSSNDTVETSNNISDTQHPAPKDALDSIGSLLSILQDKSKIKELMAMLNDQSSEKIKKKLEKLSAIVSDDEEENKIEDIEKNDIDTLTKVNEKSEEIITKEKNSKHDIESIGEIQDIDKATESSCVEKETETSINEHIKYNEDQSNSTNLTDEDSLLYSDLKNINTKENSTTINVKGGDVITEIVNKNEQSDGEDDEPLVNRINKKVRDRAGKLVLSKTHKSKNAKKSNIPKAPVKITVKKRGELQKLQEDIKEMFPSGNLLNTTGIRMCRLTKLCNEDMASKPAVVLEKIKEVKSCELPKIRKKPGPKPKIKLPENKNKSAEPDIKIKPKVVNKYKPGPKSKKNMKNDDTDPYEFDTDSVADTNTTKGSDDNCSDSENESIASSRSFGSTEVLSDTKKKPKRKRRGIGGWQSGVIKPKNRKKKDPKQETTKNESSIVKPHKLVTIPDLNCFIDKSYCFQKGVSTYDCRLCVYSGADIVNHYKKQHPHTEIPLSRMDQKTAELAIQQCQQNNFQALGKISSDKYTCRFCYKEFGNNKNVLEMFFWHVVSNHTGEYRHLCPECVNETRCPFSLDIPPPPKDVGQLIGYICKKCNFTQISLENLKTHVIVKHDDEETEVYTINLAVMSNKAIQTMLRRAQKGNSRASRSLRSNRSVGDSSDLHDDRSDASESSDHNSECDPPESATEQRKQDEVTDQKPKIDQMKAKLTFENDEPSDDTPVKIEQEEGGDENTHFDATFDAETTDPDESHRGNSDDIIDYPHFKLNFVESGAKEYVCCINGNDGHYKTSLLISMKKHIQSKHAENWDGYCCVCKVIVTLQGVKSDFRECLAHFLDKHMDDFPVLEKIAESAIEETENTSGPALNKPAAASDVASSVPAAVAAASLAGRVATPPAERTASPSYIAVRPLAELLPREPEPAPPDQPAVLPVIETVVSLEPASPAYPAAGAQPPPFEYEEVQARVMSAKHRVVLDAMMTKESLVRVFKCAGHYCSFTTDSPEDALLHASSHQRAGGEGALDCAYCSHDTGGNGIELVMHVFKEHGSCQYCCPQCFYRAAAGQLVAVHHARTHATPLARVMRAPASSTPPPAPAALLPRLAAVQHYLCHHEGGACNFSTYISDKFVEHLQLRHADAASHPCSVCGSAAASGAALARHLREHGLQLYQCAWCVHGAAGETEMLAHAASAHPDRLPQAYVRIFVSGKEGSKRVLPLVNINKSEIPTEDVVPSNTKENPVKVAERSIELEKLIAHTMKTADSSADQNVSDAQDTIEEPLEMPLEGLNHQDRDEVTVFESLLTHDIPPVKSTEPVAPADYSAPNTQNQRSLVKPEPAEVPKDNHPEVCTDIICLDSDDESSTADEAPLPSSEEGPSMNETVAQKVSSEVSISSVTDDVSIMKLTEGKSVETHQVDNRQLESVIDLSDDEPGSSNLPGSEWRVQKSVLFKCPFCLMINKSPLTLKKHVKKMCVRAGPLAQYKCPHLPCTFIATNILELLAHYMDLHGGGAKLIHCGICGASFASTPGAKSHFKHIHKSPNFTITSTTDPSGNERRVIKCMEEPTARSRISGRNTSTEIQRYQAEPSRGRPRNVSTESKPQAKPSESRPGTAPSETRRRYGVDDIDKLPISPILDSEVFCELCEFGTKVRLNMVRHLQQHAGDTPVPRTAPVNPVPHLETNEMYFDRMVNLAASSLSARAPDRSRAEPAVALRVPPAASSQYPKYVPERQRYTCGARDCAYMALDVDMFRFHWETLHPRERDFRCVHCPPTQALSTTVALTAARIVAHLRMHDVSLYACSECLFYHHSRDQLQAHLHRKHGGGTITVLREQNQPEPPPAQAGSMDLRPWQCGLCEFSSMLRPNVVNHCATDHHSKMQFKCAHCSFRSSAKENVEKHQSNVHSAMPEDVFYYFYKEGSLPDEGDIPLWQRQRKKLCIDEQDVKTEPAAEPAPAPPASPAPPTPAPLAVDLNIVKAEASEELSVASELSLEDLLKKFGAVCEPDGIKYKCCLCAAVREHRRKAMESHLYEELNYRRWECVICTYKAFHKDGLNEHMSSEHPRQSLTPRALPVDAHVETWVRAVLDHQAAAIETNLRNLSIQKVQSGPAVAAAPQKPESPKPESSASDAELQNAFGEFGAPRQHQFACPKCEFTTKHEAAMVTHLESELTKIRWGCPKCTVKYNTFHEAQFHCKTAHTGQSAQPREAIRDPSLRSGWVKAVVHNQKQFLKCISATHREHSPEKNTEDSDQNENSLLVALYDEPVHIDERPAPSGKRPAAGADSDDERLVIDEPPAKRLALASDKRCPFCDYNIHNSRYVREHILKEHYNMNPYKCCYCEFAGTRQRVTAHTSIRHSDREQRFITIEVPNYLPGETGERSETVSSTSKREKETASVTPMAKTTKRISKDSEEVAKKVCLYCEKSVPETEIESHTHGNEIAEFAKRGEVVVKCCKCLVLRLSKTSLQEHFDACHPGENVSDNYAYFKLQVDTREIHCCGHCYKKFKFLRDLKVHHASSHTSLSLSYTSIPFSYNLHTEGDTDIGKRKAEDAAGPSMKRVARKSTSKLPNSAIAKKSTTKLPHTQSELKEYSSYGTRPIPLDHYDNVTVNVPLQNTVAEVEVKKLRQVMKIQPKVVVEDYRS